MPKTGMVNEEKLVFSISRLVSKIGHPFRDNYIPQKRQNNDHSLGVLNKTKPVL